MLYCTSLSKQEEWMLSPILMACNNLRPSAPVFAHSICRRSDLAKIIACVRMRPR